MEKVAYLLGKEIKLSTVNLPNINYVVCINSIKSLILASS